MMWVFHPEIAVARKQYHLLVKVKADREDSTLARRCAKILNTDSPKMHPLSELEDSLVEIEYTDNKARLTRKFVPVRNLSIGDPSAKHPHIIFEGTLKGTIVEHKRTVGDMANVKPKGGKKNIQIKKSIMCQMELAE